MFDLRGATAVTGMTSIKCHWYVTSSVESYGPTKEHAHPQIRCTKDLWGWPQGAAKLIKINVGQFASSSTASQRLQANASEREMSKCAITYSLAPTSERSDVIAR